MQRFATISLMGPTNSGKSTLINALMGQKISITSRKVQTTRFQVMGVMTEGETQLLFIDTPGLFQARNHFDKAMLKNAWQSLGEADRVCFVFDVSRKNLIAQQAPLFQKIQDEGIEAIVILNKVDLISKEALLPIIKSLEAWPALKDVFLISAKNQDGTEALKTFLMDQAQPGNWFYAPDESALLSEGKQAAELTREKIYHFLHKELPYKIHVATERFDETKKALTIYQTVYVTSPQHKVIMLGKNGQTLKKIGQAARIDMEQVFNIRCHLYINVKVDEKWDLRKDLFSDLGLKI